MVAKTAFDMVSIRERNHVSSQTLDTPLTHQSADLREGIVNAYNVVSTVSEDKGTSEKGREGKEREGKREGIVNAYNVVSMVSEDKGTEAEKGRRGRNKEWLMRNKIRKVI